MFILLVSVNWGETLPTLPKNQTSEGRKIIKFLVCLWLMSPSFQSVLSKTFWDHLWGICPFLTIIKKNQYKFLIFSSSVKLCVSVTHFYTYHSWISSLNWSPRQNVFCLSALFNAVQKKVMLGEKDFKLSVVLSFSHWYNLREVQTEY